MEKMQLGWHTNPAEGGTAFLQLGVLDQGLHSSFHSLLPPRGMAVTHTDQSSLVPFTLCFKALDSPTACLKDCWAYCSPRGKPFQKFRFTNNQKMVSGMAPIASKFNEGPTEFLKRCSGRCSVNKILYLLNHKKFQRRNSYIEGVMESFNILMFHISKSPSLKSIKLELQTIARRVRLHHRAFKIIWPSKIAYFEYYRHNTYSKNQKT